MPLSLQLRAHPPGLALILTAAAALALALAACKQASSGPDIGRLPVLTSDDPKAEVELREADELRDAGKQDPAARKYRAFLQARPEDRLVPLAQLSLGRILLDQKKDGEALALFSAVTQHPQPAVAEQGRFYSAVASQRLGRNDEAIAALAPMVGRTIKPADTLLLLRTLANAYEAEARYFDAIATLDQLQKDAQLPEPERVEARRKLAELVSQKASPADIRKGLDELDPKGYAFRPVLTRAIKDADAARDLDRTRDLLELLEDNSIQPDEEIAAIALRAAAPSDADPAAVGALLSLSGRARRVGEQALRGLMLAANLPAQGPRPAGSPNIVFRDDAGDPARAVQAVNELVSVHRVIAIVGPMDAAVAQAAGARAQELGVPLIALTPAGTLPELGEMVFRYFPTPRSEARALAAALKSRGATSYAVLYPQTAFGETMLSAFQQEAGALGLVQGTLRSYPAGATSFGAEASALAKERFDALFVPDAAQPLALIAPALAAAGLWSTPRDQRAPKNGRAILIAAPSVAYDPNLPRLAGRYLQGALFSVPFDATSTAAPVADFVARYQEAFGSSPDVFAAFAHDAYKLVRAAVDQGANTRELVASRLASARDPSLVTPSPGFSPKREAATPTQVLELKADTFTK